MDENVRIVMRDEILTGARSIAGDDYGDYVNMAIRTTVNAGGTLNVSYGAIANSTTINERGRLILWYDGLASNTVINSGGTMIVSSGSAYKTTINSGGFISATRLGAVLISTIINPGVNLALSRLTGARVIQIVENGGYVTPKSNMTYSFASNTFTGVVLSAMDSASVHSGTTANSTTVNSGGLLELFSFGSANHTFVNSGGRLYVASYASATDIIENGGYVSVGRNADVTFVSNSFSGLVLSEQTATVHSGTTANNTVVGANGLLCVFSGGVASGVTVETDGELNVTDGTASDIQVGPGGNLYVSGGKATGIVADAEVGSLVFEVYPTTLITGTFGGTAFKFKNGHVLDYTVSSVNPLTVYECTAENIAVSAGVFSVNGGTADNTAVSDGGVFSVDCSAAADNTTVFDGGVFNVFDGTADNTEVSDGGVYVSAGGTANITTVHAGGNLYVFADGTAKNTTVNAGGFLSVVADGTAHNTTVNAGGFLSVSDGTVKNTTVSSGGSFEMAGGNLAGQMHFANGATVSIGNDTVLSFDISGRSDELPAEVEGLSMIQGTPDYKLTVSDSQTNGTYKLAEGAAGFDSVITVQSTSGGLSGTLLLGKTRNIGGTGYLLAMQNNTLVVTVGAEVDTVAPTITGIQASTSDPTNQPVVITAVFADDVELSSALYRIGETGEWTVYVDGVTVNTNDTVYFRADDAAGNESGIVEYAVTNIDVTAPELPVISADVIAPTVGDVTLTAFFSEDSAVREYSFDGETWTDYTVPVTVTENSKVFFRAADALGNVSQTDYTVRNIDRDRPEKPTLFANVTDPTFESVYVSAEFSEDSEIKEYSTDGGETWSAYAGTLEFTDNGEILFRGTDAAGNISEVASCTVANIYHVMSDVILSDGAYLSPGKTYKNTVISSGGMLHVSSGATADGVTVENGGLLHVEIGGKAVDVAENGGYVAVEDGAEINFVPGTIPELTLNDGESATVHSGTTANLIAVSSGGSFDVFSGGEVGSATVEFGGELRVLSGGKAVNIKENGGYVALEDGAEAVFVPNTIPGLVLTHGTVTLHAGTIAEDVVVNGGELNVYCEGEVNGGTVNSGVITLYSGGAVDAVTVESEGRLNVSTEGTANSVKVSSGGNMAVIHDGAAAINPEIGAGGILGVYSGGIIYSATIGEGGIFYVYSGGTANSVKVSAGGSLYLSSGGGKLTGQIRLEDGAVVSAFSGAVLDFDLSWQSPDMEVCINNLSLVQGIVPSFTLTVTDMQEKGTYRLAEGAAGFDSSITVRNELGESYGTLAFGGAVVGGDNSYRLSLDDESGLLSVTVQQRDAVLPTVSNIQVSTADPTDQPVVITAEFADNNDELTLRLYKIGEDGDWTVYEDGGVTVYHNTTVSFKAVDLDENQSEIAVCPVSNIGDLTGLVLSSGQSISVLAGETFLGTVIPVGAGLNVESGGTADGAEVQGGELSVLDGGKATEAIVTDGIMDVSAGGTATDVTVSTNGELIVSSGGTATGIVAAPGASFDFEVAQDTYVAGTSDGVEFEIKDGRISDYTVNDGLTVLSGGVANNIIVSNYCSMTISEGGSADGIALNSGGRLNVLSGGTALNIDWAPFRGQVSVQPGASVTYIDMGSGVYYGSGSKLISQAAFMVSEGIVSKYGMYVMSDGRTLDMNVFSGGSLQVFSGGTAVLTTVLYRGSMFVSSGGTAVATILGYSAGLSIASGGVASGVLLEESATFAVSSGAAADNVTIGDSARMTVSSGGVANGVSFCFDWEKPSGWLDVLSGGTLTRADICSGGRVVVAGTIDGVTVSSGGSLTVSSDGKLTGKVRAEKGAMITVKGILDFDLTQIRPSSEVRYSGLSLNADEYTITVNADQAEGIYALADGVSDSFSRTITVVNTDGEQLGTFSGLQTIMVGDVAYQLAVSDKVLTLQIGDGLDPATSSGVIADAEGTVTVGQNETFYGTVVNSGGTLVVSEGGKALETVENGGYAEVQDGAVITFVPNSFSGLVLSDTSATVHSGTTATDISVLPGGSLHVFSGGIAEDIVWTPCEGHVYLDEGVSATFASEYSGVYYGSGNLLLSSAGTMDSVLIGSSCEVYVMADGQVNGPAIGRSGLLYVAAGGIAEDIVWTPCEGHVYLENGANATYAYTYSGVYYGSGDLLLSSAETMNSVSLDSSCEMYVMSDGVANAATVHSGGRLVVGSGGFVNSVAVSNGGSMHVSSGGLVISTTVSSGGRMTVSSGGTAVVVQAMDSVRVSSGGYIAGLLISSGGNVMMHRGTAEQAFVLSGGVMSFNSGSVNSLTVFSGGSLHTFGGTATEVLISSGAFMGLAVDRNTLISGTSDGSRFRIMDGVVSDYIIESGYLKLLSGASADNVTVLSGGSLYLSSGAILTGNVTCSKGGVISAFSGAVVDFDVWRLVPELKNPVISLNDIQGTPSFTITVKDDQVNGTYRLASGASDFNQTITVTNTDGVELGTLAVGKTITVSDRDYSLVRSSGVLCLKVGNYKVTGNVIPGRTINGGSTLISSGSMMYDTIVNGGRNMADGLYVLSGGTAYNTTLNSNGKLYVTYGGVALNTVINDMGTILFEYGGVASGVTVYSTDNSLVVSSGAEVDDIVFHGNGELFVLPGGKVDGAVFHEDGMIVVSSGGTATNLSLTSGVTVMLMVAPDTYVTGTSGGSSFEIRGGIASNCGGDSNYLFVMPGGTAYDTVLQERCFLRVFSGGTACNTVINNSTTVTISSGGVLAGKTVIESGAIVNTERDAVIDFSVYMLEPGSDPLFNDLTLIKKPKSGSLLYTITVSDTQAPGTYKLFDRGSVSGNITLLNTRNETLGILRGTIVSRGNRYKFGGNTLTVTAVDLIAPTVSNIQVSTEEETTEPVIVTADFTDNLNQLSYAQYKLGENGAWLSYDEESGITVSRNTNVYFLAVDLDGNESEIVSCTISNIISDVSGLVLSKGQTDFVMPGETFSDTVISSGGQLTVSSGGTADNTAVETGALFYVSSGGTAAGATVESGGRLYVSSGGTAAGATVSSGGSMYVSSGGTAAEITENGGWVQVNYGASADFTPGVISGLSLFELTSATVHSGTTACDADIGSNGLLAVFSGGTADNTAIGADGRMSVYYDGIATGATVESGGVLYVFGGTATGIVADAGAYLSFEVDENTCVAGTSGGTVFEIRDGVVTDYAVGSGCLTICSNAAADNTAVGEFGSLQVDSGGVVTAATVATGGSMYVSSGGTATGIVADTGVHLGFEVDEKTYVTGTSDGAVFAIMDGVISGFSVDAGSLTILSGGRADDTAVNTPMGSMTVSSGGRADNISVNLGSLTVSSGGSVNGILFQGGSMTVRSGGTATGITTDGTTFMDIEVASDTCITGTSTDGAVFAIMDGVVSGFSLGSGAMTVSSGCTADRTSVDKSGSMFVSSGGTAVSATLAGSMFVSSGGTVESTTVINGSMTVLSGGTADSTAVNKGSMYVKSGGSASNTALNALMHVSSGAVVENTTVFSGGKFVISSGGTADNVTVSSGGSILLSPGGKLTGKITLNGRAFVSVTSSSIIDFDISELRPGNAACINTLVPFLGENYSYNKTPPIFTLTVSDSQETGLYTLADDVMLFRGGITVQNTLGESIGCVLLTNTLEVDKTRYSLILDEYSLYLRISVIDETAPTVSNIRSSITGPTNQAVVVTAEFLDDVEVESTWYRIGETGKWIAYRNGVTVTDNTTVFFKAVDTSGNESGVAEYRVENIDRDAPEIELVGDNTTPLRAASLTASTEDGLDIFYSTDNDTWTLYEGVLEITANGIYYFMATDAAGNTGTADIEFGNIQTVPPAPENLVGTPEKVSWGATTGAEQYIVEYSTDNFEHVIQVVTSGSAVDMPELPAGTYQWRVKSDGNGEWAVGESFVADAGSGAPKVVRSNEDGNDDLFFAAPGGTWDDLYFAKHVGSVNDWTGTNDFISASGKGRIQNLFFGSADPNVLCLTDADNGDAIFVDDVYTELPEEIEKNTARLYKIQEVRAGAGDDIVDMTSQRFEYVGDGLTIRGGDGNDVVWANKGNNRLFGDAGNDRLVGASGNDVIVGGIGDDRMHGGGGDDVFTFCGNWGADTVKQLESGTVTLWFASESDTGVWDEATLTYTDGENSVTVSGIAAEKITLKFGENGPEDAAQFAALSDMGAFDDFTSRKIFEESKGLLAGQ